MSVESHCVAALHSERVLVEDEVSFLIPRTGQCLTCMASGVLIGAKLSLNLPTRWHKWLESGSLYLLHVVFIKDVTD